MCDHSPVYSLASLCSDWGALLIPGHQLMLHPKERTEQGAEGSSASSCGTSLV